jgi:hypothetical protein
MTAVGVPTESAVAALLFNHLVGGYPPGIPGWFAIEHLIRRGEL